MLPARVKKPVDYHEAVFLSRYDQLYTWARQLAKGNHAEAEDLVQDTFIDFIHSRPDLSAVQNLDAFLYTILRNIHRSQLQRHLRRRNLLLLVIDYDSANLGLHAAAPVRLLEVREPLHRVCQFACERKNSSKAGSLLILRFFHGYYPAEIVHITHWDRATVDARLTHVRREARIYIESGDPLRAVDLPAAPALSAGLESQAVLGELRSRIFAAVEGPCLTRADIRKLYCDGASQGPDRAVLSHIVSCAACLEAVNSALGLDSSSDRGFGESEGPQPPRSSNGTPARNRREARRQVGKWRRDARDIFEHQPRELMIVVNGGSVAWQSVTFGRNDFAVRLPRNEAIEFIEIFSEQEVRLLSLAVPDSAPPAVLEWTKEVSLSDGRSLTVTLRFETLGPEISVAYNQPSAVEAPATFRTAPSEDRAQPRWRGFLRPRPALWAFALLAIVLLLRPGRQTTASAAALLVRVQAQERVAAAQPGLVAHRSLRMEERIKGRDQVLSHRRIEIWRDGRKDARPAPLCRRWHAACHCHRSQHHPTHLRR
jgi:RNA polymerase sigma factor (sigma-70 family)